MNPCAPDDILCFADSLLAELELEAAKPVEPESPPAESRDCLPCLLEDWKLERDD